jgi:hypothetical protein
MPALVGDGDPAKSPKVLQTAALNPSADLHCVSLHNWLLPRIQYTPPILHDHKFLCFESTQPDYQLSKFIGS